MKSTAVFNITVFLRIEVQTSKRGQQKDPPPPSGIETKTPTTKAHNSNKLGDASQINCTHYRGPDTLDAAQEFAKQFHHSHLPHDGKDFSA